MCHFVNSQALLLLKKDLALRLAIRKFRKVMRNYTLLATFWVTLQP